MPSRSKLKSMKKTPNHEAEEEKDEPEGEGEGDENSEEPFVEENATESVNMSLDDMIEEL